MANPSAHSFKRLTLRGWVGYLLSFLLGIFLSVGGYRYWLHERSLPQEVFSENIYLIDQIIYSQLYDMSISKKDVLLHQTSLKKEGKFSWEQSFLKIKLPKPIPFPLVEGNFRRGLGHLGRSVSLHVSHTKDLLQLEVSLKGRTTHQLTFVPSQTTAVKTGLRPKVAIVIDDLGLDYSISKELLQWDLPLTLSILPFTPHARRIATEAHQKGKEVILHLPMEPQGYPETQPGEGMLLKEMDEERLLRQLSRDIEEVPYIKGVSNHMGSRLMEDPEKVKVILSELKRRGLYFLDSRTTPQTVGLKVAKSIGMRAGERNLFIDHSLNEEDIRQKIESLIQFSLANGKAIGIAHLHPTTLKSLKAMIPKLKEMGIELVPLSVLME